MDRELVSMVKQAVISMYQEYALIALADIEVLDPVPGQLTLLAFKLKFPAEAARVTGAPRVVTSIAFDMRELEEHAARIVSVAKERWTQAMIAVWERIQGR